MKLTITTENSNNLAAVVNAMAIILLMDVDECNAEQESSELPDQTISSASYKQKNEIINDKCFKIVDLFHQNPLMKRVTLVPKIWHLYPKPCDSNVEIKEKENWNLLKLNGTNQVNKITNVDNDVLSNINSIKEIKSGLNLDEKTNELRGKIITTLNNPTENIPTSLNECYRLQKKSTLKSFKTDYKQVEIMSHFKTVNFQSMSTLADKILETENEHKNVIRKMRQIDQAETTLTFNNDRIYKTLKNDKNNIIITTQDKIANKNSETVKDALNYQYTMETINKKSPKFDLNKASFITFDEKRPISNCYKSTKSVVLPELSDMALKRSRATKNSKIKKYNKEAGIKRKTTDHNKFLLPGNNESNVWNSTENYEAMQKNPSINKTQSNIKSDNLMLNIVNKIRNYYKSYENKSMVLGQPYSIKHKLPYGKTLQYNGRDLFPFVNFFSSPHLYQKYESTNRLKNIKNIIDCKWNLKTNRFYITKSTRASSDLYYIKLAKKVFGSTKEHDTTTPFFVPQNKPDIQLDMFDDEEVDDDDDLQSSAAVVQGYYNVNNDCYNNNDNRYNYFTYAITNENNVNNVILINYRTTITTTTTTTTTTTRSPIFPAVQVVKEEFPMDHNLLLAIIFTSFVILVFTTCCCAPIVLIKKQKECIVTQDISSSSSSSSDSEDSTISFYCK